MKSLRSYSSSFAMGHKVLERLFDGTVIVTEKIDGSQFSFGITDDGTIVARSRRQELYANEQGDFAKAITTAHELAGKGLLHPGWTYRCEFLNKPKHNTLSYSRVPKKHIILFDIDKGYQDYLGMEELASEAKRLGLECVPVLAIYDTPPSIDELKALLDTESILGGTKIEGIAIKNYNQYAPDKKVLFGKLVRADFVEKHDVEWRKQNPTKKEFIESIIEAYATEARWQKAIQHLQESNMIEGKPQDIPIITQEIIQDTLEDCGEEIANMLFAHFWKDISRGLTRGFPHWYKERIG